jgi:hypothetical protein
MGFGNDSCAHLLHLELLLLIFGHPSISILPEGQACKDYEDIEDVFLPCCKN